MARAARPAERTRSQQGNGETRVVTAGFGRFTTSDGTQRSHFRARPKDSDLVVPSLSRLVFVEVWEMHFRMAVRAQQAALLGLSGYR